MSIDLLRAIADDLGIVPLPMRMSDHVGRGRCTPVFGSRFKRRALTMGMAERMA